MMMVMVRARVTEEDDASDDLPCCQPRDVSSRRASHGEAAQGRERHSRIHVLCKK